MCNRAASWYSASAPGPVSSSGVSRYRFAGLRLSAHVDQAGQGQIAPAAWQVLEAAAGAGHIDLQPAMASSASPGCRSSGSRRSHSVLQHIRSLLKTNGRAAVVLPDNVLVFERPAGALHTIGSVPPPS